MPGRIGCKSIEIKTTKFNQAAILCTGRHTNVIPVNLHPIAQKFMPGRIRPVELGVNPLR